MRSYRQYCKKYQLLFMITIVRFRENPHRYPLDPPLTKRGSKMAKISANEFKKNHGDVSLSCVFTSPLHRAFMTAYEFAKTLDLPLVIVPGLACAAACQQFGPIITKSDGTMALKKKVVNQCHFFSLSKPAEVQFHFF